jgi:diaminopimelate decarboxylase
VTAEPGRAIARAAALTLYTVGTVKDIPASAPTSPSTAA